jgi:uncharacterized protein YifN (PemK superfamily)
LNQELINEINNITTFFDNDLNNTINEINTVYVTRLNDDINQSNIYHDDLLAQRLQELDDRYAQDILENVTNLSQFYYDESNNKINIDLSSQVSSLQT